VYFTLKNHFFKIYLKNNIINIIMNNFINLEKNDIQNEIHPCKYCGNFCKGKQCRDCHLKMISTQCECIDCSIKFIPLRCFNCENFQAKNSLNNCPECGNIFCSLSKSGKTFQTCYDCYQNDFSNCKKCNKRCLKKYSFCKQCYPLVKNEEDIEKKCESKDCYNKTNYNFCQDCYKTFNFVKQ
jgi:hypothetical protein